MTSRTLLNLTLALALAGLIALAIYEPGKNETPGTTRLTQFKPEEIQQIRVQSPGQSEILIEKMNGHWQMQTPFIVSANQQRLTQLLKVLQSKSHATYDAEQVDHKQLQLDTPLLSLTFNNTRLDIGGIAPMGESRYMRISDSVHLITDRYSHLARGPATQLVSPALLHKNASIVALQLPAFKLTLVDAQWKIENGETTHNPDQLQMLLDEWRHARAASVEIIGTRIKASHKTPAKIIKVITRHQNLQFTLLQTDDEIILQRHDLGLQYHFSREMGQRLLTLAKTNDA